MNDIIFISKNLFVLRWVPCRLDLAPRVVNETYDAETETRPR